MMKCPICSSICHLCCVSGQPEQPQQDQQGGPRPFRHSGSQIMKLAGAPIEEISSLLHHQGLDVTKKHYLREDRKKLQESRDKYGI